MQKRNLYLSNTAIDDANKQYMDALKGILKLSYEKIPVKVSLHRVTRYAVYAKYCSPLFNTAAMDGIGVISARTKGACEKYPVTLHEGADYIVIDTGDPIKMPFDAVIMAEDLIETIDGSIKILEAAVPWQHIRPIGEDIVVGEMILPSRHKIRPIDIGVLLSAGITEVEVVEIPTVAIYPTGTEMIEPELKPNGAEIIESNSQMLAGMVTEAGGIALRFPPIKDDYDLIKKNILKAIKHYDMIIMNAGSSAGREDYIVHVLKELGTVLIHGVAIKPGKPVILAIVDNKPVIGLPGYPVSAYIGFENFVIPVLSLLTDTTQKVNTRVEAIISRRLVSSLKHKEYVRVKVGCVEGNLIAAPLARGAGAAMSLVRADGFCVISQNQEGVEAGEKIFVELYRDVEEIKSTLVLIGSHDLVLDILADLLPLSSTHVGSMGGLVSLGRGETHIAPVHLLDDETGEYNIPYLKRVCKEPMALIKGVGRIQGLIIKKGNPKNITGISDLINCTYINRQRGAGTRILLDYKLKRLNISPESISGYDREAATHMAVAAAVSSDSADTGMGIFSAARALNLDFVEICTEEYDFAIPQKFLEIPDVQSFIKVIQSENFKKRLEKLGGYRYDQIGKVIIV